MTQRGLGVQHERSREGNRPARPRLSETLTVAVIRTKNIVYKTKRAVAGDNRTLRPETRRCSNTKRDSAWWVDSGWAHERTQDPCVPLQHPALG